MYKLTDKVLFEQAVVTMAELRKELENITNMYLAQVELTGKYNQERKELQEAYEGIKEELKRAHSYIRMEEED